MKTPSDGNYTADAVQTNTHQDSSSGIIKSDSEPKTKPNDSSVASKNALPGSNDNQAGGNHPNLSTNLNTIYSEMKTPSDSDPMPDLAANVKNEPSPNIAYKRINPKRPGLKTKLSAIGTVMTGQDQPR